MEITLGNTLRIAEHIVFRQLDDEAVLLDLKSGTYFGLNPVGTRIWQLVADGKTLSTVMDMLAAEFDVQPDELQRDLLALGEQLCARGLTAPG
jgi:hypothetical protein